MTPLVVWMGPVSASQVQGATLPGAAELFLSCCGDLTPPCIPPTCPELGDELAASPALLFAAAGVPDVGPLALGAFSAGGSVARRLLEQDAYRQRVEIVHAADAMFSASWQDVASRTPPAIEGFVRFGVDAANDDSKLFVATSSPSPNGVFATGIENMRAVRAAIEKRTGRTFEKRTDFFGIEPAPSAVYQLGGVIFAEYPAEPLGHGHTAIAAQVWRNIVIPRAQRSAVGSSLGALGALFGGGALLWLLSRRGRR